MAMQTALLQFGAEVLLPMMLLIGEQAWRILAFLYRQEHPLWCLTLTVCAWEEN